MMARMRDHSSQRLSWMANEDHGVHEHRGQGLAVLLTVNGGVDGGVDGDVSREVSREVSLDWALTHDGEGSRTSLSHMARCKISWPLCVVILDPERSFLVVQLYQKGLVSSILASPVFDNFWN